MHTAWRRGVHSAFWAAGLALGLAAEAQDKSSSPSPEPLTLHARVRELASPAKDSSARSFVVKEKVLQWEPGADGDHHLRHVEPALVPGSDPPGRRAGPGDEPDDRRGAGQGRPHHPRPQQLHGRLQGPPRPQTGAGGPQGREPPRAHRRVVQQDSRRGEGDLPDRPVRRRLRRRAAVPAGVALEVADRRHRDPRRGRDQRLGRRDLEPARKPRASPT